jgi:ubiquinone/menaquinone biosynthesis C-methylase UbiE
MDDAVALRLALQQERAADLEQRLVRLLAPLAGDERALDAGCGTGSLSHALALHVAEVVGVDTDEAFLEAARGAAPANCTFLPGDVMALPFDYGQFDIAGSLRVLHHVRRPELVVSELARVTRSGGRVVLADQLADVDPMVALEQDRFERERDPSHTRLLSDADIRGLLEANDLVVLRNEATREQRDVERFLDLAGLAGDERARIRRMAPAAIYEIELGWYVARKL